MNRMKKLLIVSAIGASLFTLAQFAQAKDPYVKAYCNSVFQEGRPGFVNIPTKHGVTITNKTPTTIVYDVYFDNFVQYPKQREMPVDYTEAPYTHNAHVEHHFSVASGQTLYFGEETIQKMAGFIHKGRYKTKATTLILFNGTLLDNCEYFNNVFIS